MTDKKDTNNRLIILNTFTAETLADGLNAEDAATVLNKLVDFGWSPLVITSVDGDHCTPTDLINSRMTQAGASAGPTETQRQVIDFLNAQLADHTTPDTAMPINDLMEAASSITPPISLGTLNRLRPIARVETTGLVGFQGGGSGWYLPAKGGPTLA